MSGGAPSARTGLEEELVDEIVITYLRAFRGFRIEELPLLGHGVKPHEEGTKMYKAEASRVIAGTQRKGSG